MHAIIRHLKNWIECQYGLIIPDQDIEWKIEKLLDELQLTEYDFFSALQKNQTQVIHKILAKFTIPESYFFRNQAFFDYLQHTELPQIIAKKLKSNDLHITIWSAGCASGEEIYSVAILLDQLIPQPNLWQIQLIGTDINEEILQKGREGLFYRGSMRSIDQVLLSKYFDVQEYDYVLKKYIRDRVEFKYNNIADMRHNPTQCDIIFCRNVFIYLNRRTIISALEKFYQSLQPNGILLLSPTDLVTYYPHKFQVNNVLGFQILRKPSKIIHQVNQFDCLPAKVRQEKRIQVKDICAALQQKNYLEAINKIHCLQNNHAESALLLRYKAEAYLGLGEISAAIKALSHAIKTDPLDEVSHFLQAMVALDNKDQNTAIHALQKALYLNHQFPEAAYYLGLIHLQNQQWGPGLKFLRHALKAAEKLDKKTTVLCAEGTMEQLIQSICEKLTYYQDQHHE